MANETLSATAVPVDNLVIEVEETVNRTIKTGQTLLRGCLLTKEHVFTAGAATAVVGNTGGDTFSAVTATAAARAGTYKIVALTATTYKVVRPDGVALSVIATAGSAYAQELGFTITTAGAATVAGDSYTVAVTEVAGKMVKTVAGGNIDGIVKEDITTTADTSAEIYYAGVYNLGVVETATGITVTEAMQDSGRVNDIMVGTR